MRITNAKFLKETFTVMSLFLLIFCIGIPVYAMTDVDSSHHISNLFSINYPSEWHTEENELFFESGWIVSLYDHPEDWNIRIDVSQPDFDYFSFNLKKQDVIENIFLSNYYLCQENTFDRKFFNDLSPEIKIVLTNHHQSQLNDNLTETQNISEWWQELTDDEIDSFFNNNLLTESISPSLTVIPSDYLLGEMCEDFVPIDYKITDTEEYIRYQIFYTWTQTFPDGTYFENYSQVNDLWISQGIDSHVISLSSISSINEFDFHSDSVELLIDSMEIFKYDHLLASKIPPEVRINMGFWANNQIEDHDFRTELESLINSGIISAPHHISSLEKIEISDVPHWLKNPTNWWYEQAITDDEYFIIVEHLLSNNSIKHNFSPKH